MNMPGIVSKWLRADVGVAALVGDRAYTMLPGNKAFPMILVARVGGAPTSDSPLWIEDVALQLDLWADRQAETESLRAAVVAALAALPGEVYEGLVVSKVTFRNTVSVPDTSLSPTKPRLIVDLVVRCHPA